MLFRRIPWVPERVPYFVRVLPVILAVMALVSKPPTHWVPVWTVQPAQAEPPRVGRPELSRPAAVPNLLDPEVLARFVMVATNRLNGDPDFPLALIINAETLELLAFVLDARNGRDTWSLLQDPVIFWGLFTPQEELRTAYADEGFLTHGTASGKWVEADADVAPALLVRVRAAHGAVRGASRITHRPACSNSGASHSSCSRDGRL